MSIFVTWLVCVCNIDDDDSLFPELKPEEWNSNTTTTGKHFQTIFIATWKHSVDQVKFRFRCCSWLNWCDKYLKRTHENRRKYWNKNTTFNTILELIAYRPNITSVAHRYVFQHSRIISHKIELAASKSDVLVSKVCTKSSSRWTCFTLKDIFIYGCSHHY